MSRRARDRGTTPERRKGGQDHTSCPPSRNGARPSLVGDGLLQGAAGGDLHAVAGRDLDLLTGLRVAAGTRGALDALDGQQARDLDSLALADGLDKHVLQ